MCRRTRLLKQAQSRVHNNLHSERVFVQALRFVPLFILTLMLLITACQTLISEDVSPTVEPFLQHAAPTAELVTTPICKSDASFVLRVDGSELIAPVTRSIAGEFLIQNSHMCAIVDGSGTKRGFERLCSGEIHINQALLWVRRVDSELCRQNDIEWLELPVAYNGFGNFVSTQNDFIECLTTDQNRQIWSPTNAARVWDELAISWPNREIHRYAALNERGSPIFVDSPLYQDAEILDHLDTALVDNLAADPFGIGLFSTAYYVGNEDRIKHVSIDDGQGCISINPLTVEPGQRPVWGHLIHIYVNRQALHDNQALQEFLDFYMTKAFTTTQEQGFFALSPEEYEDNRDLIRNSAAAP